MINLHKFGYIRYEPTMNRVIKSNVNLNDCAKEKCVIGKNYAVPSLIPSEPDKFWQQIGLIMMECLVLK